MASIVQQPLPPPTLANIDKHLGSDIAHEIAKTVHTMRMSDLVPPLLHTSRTRNPLETALDKPTPLNYLTEVHGAKVYMDNYLYWETVVIHMPSTNRFFMWHHYTDSPREQDIILIDGFVEDNALKVERCMYEDTYIAKRFYSINTRLQKTGGINTIPFTFLAQTVLNRVEDLPFELSYRSGKKWDDPDRVCEWFANLSSSLINEHL
jgi:hypothetical protein